MKPVALTLNKLRDNLEASLGRVVAINVPDFERGTGFLFRKGEILQPQDRLTITAKWETLVRFAPPGYSLHLLQMEEGEVSEDEAGSRLALLVAGPNLTLSAPVESRVNLVAARRGLLRVDVPRLELVNEVPGMAVFTLFDNMAVEIGTEVAGAKVTPLVYALSRLEEVAEICAGRSVLEILPFQPLKVGVVVREQLKPGPQARFSTAVSAKLAWFGAELLGISLVENNGVAVAAGLSEFKERGAELILHVGGHSSDPLDALFPALANIGARMERLGAPAHPGTLFWLAYWEQTTLFGLASCGMFSKTTLGDLFLARLMAGIHLTARDIARMGHGGLFTREMAFRFPPYGLQLNDQD